MRERAIILLHGMGTHTAKSFKKEVINGTKNALNRYPTYANEDIESNVDLISIEYDSIFEERRQALKEAGDNLSDYISKIPGVPNVVDVIARMQSRLGEDKFENTHILDVVLYLSLVGELVRYHVADKIEETLQKYGSDKVSIFAHSLGTAVLHDTLQKLYTTGLDGEKHIQLNVAEHNLQSIWMFANVSPIITRLNKFPGPLESLVKPGAGGCTQMFFNAFNSWDPFTIEIINRFNPPDDGNWIDAFTYQLNYNSFKTTDISRLNTHSIKGYIEDPVICHPLLEYFLKEGFGLDDQEKTEGDAKFINLEDEAIKIRDYVNTIDNSDDFVEFLKMIKDYIALLKSMGEDF